MQQLHSDIFDIGARGLHEPDLTLLYQFDKSLSLDAIDGFGPTLAITRATSATYFDSAGVMQTAASGAARFDHDPADNTSLGLLVEEARTNVCLQAREFDTTWVDDIAAPVLTQDQTGIDGTANQAWSIEDNNASATEGRRQDVTISDDSNTHCFSIYVLKDTDTTRFPEIVLRLLSGTAQEIFYDINTQTGAGTIRASVGTVTGEVTDAGLWWRVVLTVTNNTSGNTTARFIIRPATGTVFGVNDDAAQGTTIFDAAQLELNASFPTSFIDTTTVSVTRNKDEVKTTDVTWYNAIEGTLYAKARSLHNASINGFILSINDGSADNRIAWLDSSQQARVVQTAATATVVDMGPASKFSAGTLVRMAGAHILNDVELYVDGTRTGTGDQAAAMPSSISELDVGMDALDTNHFNGHIAEVRYYNTRRPNQFLEDLSNGLIVP